MPQREAPPDPRPRRQQGGPAAVSNPARTLHDGRACAWERPACAPTTGSRAARSQGAAAAPGAHQLEFGDKNNDAQPGAPGDAAQRAPPPSAAARAEAAVAAPPGDTEAWAQQEAQQALWYYEANMLLYKLHLERAHRQQQQQQPPGTEPGGT